MNVSSIFSSFIAAEQVEVSDSVLKKARELLSDVDQYYLNLDEPEFAELIALVSVRFSELGRDILGINDKHNLYVDQAWINKGGAVNIVEPHIHYGKLLSACYYINVTKDDSYLKFVSPIPMVAEKLPATTDQDFLFKTTEFNSSVVKVNSQSGLLVFFPSWLMHYVHIINDSERISMAFNASAKRVEAVDA